MKHSPRYSESFLPVGLHQKDFSKRFSNVTPRQVRPTFFQKYLRKALQGHILSCDMCGPAIHIQIFIVAVRRPEWLLRQGLPIVALRVQTAAHSRISLPTLRVLVEKEEEIDPCPQQDQNRLGRLHVRCSREERKHGRTEILTVRPCDQVFLSSRKILLRFYSVQEYSTVVEERRVHCCMIRGGKWSLHLSVLLKMRLRDTGVLSTFFFPTKIAKHGRTFSNYCGVARIKV